VLPLTPRILPLFALPATAHSYDYYGGLFQQLSGAGLPTSCSETADWIHEGQSYGPAVVYTLVHKATSGGAGFGSSNIQYTLVYKAATSADGSAEMISYGLNGTEVVQDKGGFANVTVRDVSVRSDYFISAPTKEWPEGFYDPAAACPYPAERPPGSPTKAPAETPAPTTAAGCGAGCAAGLGAGGAFAAAGAFALVSARKKVSKETEHRHLALHLNDL
jgi:hypothetical protein